MERRVRGFSQHCFHAPETLLWIPSRLPNENAADRSAGASMEIPRVLRQAPPTRPLALLMSQQTTVMSRLTWIAARLWKCGTRLRTRSFILHFMRGLCVVKSSGAVCNREIEHQKKKKGEIRFSAAFVL